MIVPAQMEDLVDDLLWCLAWTAMRPQRSVSQTSYALLLVAPEPIVVGHAADAEVTTSLGNIACALGVLDDLESPGLKSVEMLFSHEISFLEQDYSSRDFICKEVLVGLQ